MTNRVLAAGLRPCRHFCRQHKGLWSSLAGQQVFQKKNPAIGTNSFRRTLYARWVTSRARSCAHHSNNAKGLGMTSNTEFGPQTAHSDGLMADGFIKAPKPSRRGFAAMDENLRRLIASKGGLSV